MSGSSSPLPQVFPVEDAEAYVGAFPSFRQPKLRGFFSLDAQREIRHDISQLMYFNIRNMSSVPMNLALGVHCAIKKNMEEVKNEGLKSILQWILKNQGQLLTSTAPSLVTSRIPADFVCYRGLLTTIMTTPYERKEGWIILAVKFRGSIYLRAVETQQKKNFRRNASDHQKEMESWGFKFEQYVLRKDPSATTKKFDPVNENEEFNCVFSSKLCEHTLLYAAEMDGMESQMAITEQNMFNMNNKFIEVKTNRHIESQRHDVTFRKFKLIKWWAQCFTVGIEKVVCGYRDDYGVISTIKEHSVRDIPKMATEFWKPSNCMRFLDRFLSFVKSVVKDNSPTNCYEFNWKPKEPVTVNMYDLDDELVLPAWYKTSLFAEMSGYNNPLPPLFPVEDAKAYDGVFPHFKKPRLLGLFSLDANGEYRQDLSQLMYYKRPNVRPSAVDLEKSAIKKDVEEAKNEGLKDVLQWILNQQVELRTNDVTSLVCNCLPVDFVCHGDLLAAIMITPYRQNEGWLIQAAKFRDTIYMCALETHEEKMARTNVSQHQKDMESWKCKFQQFVLGKEPNAASKASGPVNENGKFNCIFTSEVCGHKLLYGAEVDGVESEIAVTEQNLFEMSDRFVAVETSRQIETQSQDVMFRKCTLMEWWSQCFVVGIGKVVCGCRDDTGTVLRVSEHGVSDMPKKATEFWKPSNCVNFLDQFLTYVKSVVTVDSPSRYYHFEWRPRQSVFAKVFDLHNELVLPNWYRNRIFSSI